MGLAAINPFVSMHEKSSHDKQGWQLTLKKSLSQFFTDTSPVGILTCAVQSPRSAIPLQTDSKDWPCTIEGRSEDSNSKVESSIAKDMSGVRLTVWVDLLTEECFRTTVSASLYTSSNVLGFSDR